MWSQLIELTLKNTLQIFKTLKKRRLNAFFSKIISNEPFASRDQYWTKTGPLARLVGWQVLLFSAFEFDFLLFFTKKKILKKKGRRRRLFTVFFLSSKKKAYLSEKNTNYKLKFSSLVIKKNKKEKYLTFEHGVCERCGYNRPVNS